MKVTVAICTWNRCKLLDQTLAEMHKLLIPPAVEWELLVVNNNCTDETDTVIARHAEQLPIRRLFEPKQGIANARNCAARAASGELLLWADNDVLVDRNWVEEFVRAAANWPQAAYFGGTIDPWFVSQPPRWVLAHWQQLTGVFAIRQFGNDVRPLRSDEDVFSASMAFRTAVLRQYDFDPRLGRIGADLLSAEEVALVKQIRRDGHQGVWVGTARVRHFVPPERLTRRYVWQFIRGLGRSDYRQHGVPEEPKTLWGAPRWLLKQYWINTLLASLYSPFKGKRWMARFYKAAFLRGWIDAFRETNATKRHTTDDSRPRPHSRTAPLK